MTHEHEPTCQEVVELVTDYLEGRLAGDARERFEGHLQVCPHCARYLDQMRTVIRAMGRVHAGDLAPEAREELVEVFRTWRAGRGGLTRPDATGTSGVTPRTPGGP